MVVYYYYCGGGRKEDNRMCIELDHHFSSTLKVLRRDLRHEMSGFGHQNYIN